MSLIFVICTFASYRVYVHVSTIFWMKLNNFVIVAARTSTLLKTSKSESLLGVPLQRRSRKKKTNNNSVLEMSVISLSLYYHKSYQTHGSSSIFSTQINMVFYTRMKSVACIAWPLRKFDVEFLHKFNLQRFTRLNSNWFFSPSDFS